MVEQVEQLILEAFGQARAAGKPEWYRMTAPVLKNRLLNLTNGTFNEAEYGASSFTMFISQFTGIVDIDKSCIPPVIELLGQAIGLESRYAPLTGSPPLGTQPKIRSDLWQATIDYSSGIQYVWDILERIARPSESMEDAPVIPTVNQAIHKQWRKDFMDTIKSSIVLTPEQEDQTRRWIEHKFRTAYLPRQLILKWNGFFRDKVHQHLLSWFEQSKLDSPVDLIVHTSVRPPAKRAGTEALRRFVYQVIQEMTDQELAQLNLPLRATHQVAQRSRR